jgi:hypothetical protein
MSTARTLKGWVGPLTGLAGREPLSGYVGGAVAAWGVSPLWSRAEILLLAARHSELSSVSVAVFARRCIVAMTLAFAPEEDHIAMFALCAEEGDFRPWAANRWGTPA